ncbi:hypothetical protein C8F04DRAFT_1267978 [Mycena alexandri]|uniref:Ribonuclease H1 N-terminal domain-containing protein n=1 Tax=Mycena alexandri TaxID=1745969 RepID=A0AAD6WTI6_9AGAR|nr:hypothetical protein C8F04DRAFT_1267978 [Mycena alexandri]
MPASTWIPDTKNPDHDPKFWCLPKIHDTPSDTKAGGYPLYLITDGREVGVWHNWTVAKKMVEGYPSNGYRGHHTLNREEGPPSTPTTASGPEKALHAIFALELNILGLAFDDDVGFDVERLNNNVGGSPYRCGKGIFFPEDTKIAFLLVEAQGLKPSVFFGADQQEAHSFAHGAYWIQD